MWLGQSDHVTIFGSDGAAPLPYPFVNPGDICDVVPFIPHSASQLGSDDDDDADADEEYEDEDEEGPEPVAVEEPNFDNSLEQVDASLASLSAEPVAMVEEPVNECVFLSYLHPASASDRPSSFLLFRPEVVVKPSALRPSKR